MDRTSTFTALARYASSVLSERFRTAGRRGLRMAAFASIGAAIVGSLASPAMAASEPNVSLIRCAEQSCLQISGHRDDPVAIVSINGQVVPVQGEHRWRVRLPVEVVRQMSRPLARTVEISLRDPETQREIVASVDLPIGLLGRTTDLSSLVITAR